MDAAQSAKQPVAYWVEYWADDYTIWTVAEFKRQGSRAGRRIQGLFPHPVEGGSPEPVAYKGRYWTTAKDFACHNAHDPGAAPMWAGPVMQDPD